MSGLQLHLLWRSIIALACFCQTPANAERFAVHNHRIFIGVRVNGVSTEALVDSAAEASLVDRGLARDAGFPMGNAVQIKGSGGSAAAQIVEGVPIEVLGLVLHPDGIAVTDLRDISRRLVKRRVEMVVGRELFDAARLTIDIRAQVIKRSTADPTGVLLKLAEHAGIKTLPVAANGVRAQAEFDLGNGSEIMISKPFAATLGLTPIGQSVGGGIGGPLRRDVVELERLEVAGMVFRHVRAAVDVQGSASDLNIGTRVLRHFRITTDFSKNQIWLDARRR